MNIQNITALASHLTSLGFEDLSSILLKRIAFKPASFVLSQKITREQHLLTFNLFFTRLPETAGYMLVYYDAIFQKEQDHSMINGIDILMLKKKMMEVDWVSAFDLSILNNGNAEENHNVENADKIEAIMEDLLLLESSEEGRIISTNLKLKHWTGTNYQEVFGALATARTKTEISQRFYFSEGHIAISVNEAHRFLQNKWLEREIKERKKEGETADGDGSEGDFSTSSNTGPLRKKRVDSPSKKARKISAK